MTIKLITKIEAKKIQLKYKTIIIASNNKNKVEEYKSILEPLGFDVLASYDLFFDNFPTEGIHSYRENAYHKAKAFVEDIRNDAIVIAEDSGLEVSSLFGSPGIQTADYIKKYDSLFEANLSLAESIPVNSSRDASFTCTIVTFIGSLYYTFNGRVEGTIIEPSKLKKFDEEVFGFDPLFIPNGSKSTFSNLKNKNKISHRFIAVAEFLSWLTKVIDRV